MKTIKKIIPVLLVGALCLVISACGQQGVKDKIYRDNDINQEILQQMIPGTWKMEDKNGEECGTDERVCKTFTQDGKYKVAVAHSDNDYFINDNNDSYTIDGQNIITELDTTLQGKTVHVKCVDNVIEISKDSYSINHVKYIDNVEATKYYARYARVLHDYSKNIIGTWEPTSDDNEQLANHRWRFNENHTLVRYSKNSSGDWAEDNFVEKKYACVGDFLIIAFKETNSSKTQYIWLDIKINVDIMECSKEIYIPHQQNKKITTEMKLVS